MHPTERFSHFAFKFNVLIMTKVMVTVIINNPDVFDSEKFDITTPQSIKHNDVCN